MARYWFGGGTADWVMTVGDTVTIPGVVARDAVAVGGIPVTVWNARTGGVQHTDLISETGSAVDQVTASIGSEGYGLGQIPAFRGPDGVREMWASAGDGPRALLVGRVDALDRNGDRMVGPMVLADGSPAASQAYSVAKSGDAMTGPLSVPTPTAPSHAATKKYTDDLFASGGGGGGGAVASVNGKTGVVTLTAADVGAAPSAHTHTTGQVTGLDAALAGKAAIAHDHPNRVAGYRHNGTSYVPATDLAIYVGPVDPGSVADNSVWIQVTP